MVTTTAVAESVMPLSQHDEFDALTHHQGLLTVHEVAAYLQVKAARVYEAVRERRLRAVKVGRLLRFRPRDVETFLDRHTVSVR